MPPALSEYNSTSIGISSNVSRVESPVKPGARFFDAATGDELFWACTGAISAARKQAITLHLLPDWNIWHLLSHMLARRDCHCTKKHRNDKPHSILRGRLGQALRCLNAALSAV